MGTSYKPRRFLMVECNGETKRKIKTVVERKDYASMSDFIRKAIKDKLRQHKAA